MKDVTFSQLQQKISHLASRDIIGYGAKPIPNEIDDAMHQLIECYLTLKKEEREEIYSELNQLPMFLFLAFAERMASLAVRERSKNTLNQAVVALAFSVGKGDDRECLPVLSLIYLAAQKIGLEPESFFNELCDVFEKNSMLLFTNFLNRSERDKSIKAMGYMEGVDDGGFRFVRTW